MGQKKEMGYVEEGKKVAQKGTSSESIASGGGSSVSSEIVSVEGGTPKS
jgi:hypothetical protein